MVNDRECIITNAIGYYYAVYSHSKRQLHFLEFLLRMPVDCLPFPAGLNEKVLGFHIKMEKKELAMLDMRRSELYSLLPTPSKHFRKG